jgi:hypothetical protein
MTIFYVHNIIGKYIEGEKLLAKLLQEDLRNLNATLIFNDKLKKRILPASERFKSEKSPLMTLDESTLLIAGYSTNAYSRAFFEDENNQKIKGKYDHVMEGNLIKDMPSYLFYSSIFRKENPEISQTILGIRSQKEYKISWPKFSFQGFSKKIEIIRGTISRPINSKKYNCEIKPSNFSQHQGSDSFLFHNEVHLRASIQNVRSIAIHVDDIGNDEKLAYSLDLLGKIKRRKESIIAKVDHKENPMLQKCIEIEILKVKIILQKNCLML